MAELDTSTRGRACTLAGQRPGVVTGTVDTRHVQPGLAELNRFAAALGLRRGADDRLLPLDHWAFDAPPCITGTAIRTRFLRAVPTDLGVEITVRSGYRHDTLIHEVRVGSKVAVTTSVLDTHLSPGPKVSHGAPRLVGSHTNLEGVLETISASPLDVSNRSAIVLLLAAAHGSGRPPLLGMHAEFRAPVTELDRLHVDLRLSPDGRGDFAIGRPEAEALVSGQLWFGCGTGQ